MRVAVISDIHANLHALEAVVEAIEREAPDAIWCLGDLVGYGPQPNECCAWAAGARGRLPGRATTTSACSARSTSTTSAGDAAAAARWTRGVLDADARTYLSEPRRRAPSATGVGLFHASPRDPVWEYVLSWEAARDAIHDSGTDVTLVGHSHVPLAIADGRGAAGRARRRAGPRSTSPAAAGCSTRGRSASRGTATPERPGCCSTSRRAARRSARVPYDVERTQAEIRERGTAGCAGGAPLAHGV